jgi:hypothetical protein
MSLLALVRFLFALLFTAAVGARRAPTNRTASPPFVFVAPLRL